MSWPDPPKPPSDPSQYIGSRDYFRNLESPYFRDGQKVASSRKVPFEGELPPVGSWRIDDFKGIHGRDIAELERLPLNKLDLPEIREGKLDPLKRGDDERYAQWLKEGRRAPPIEVIQRDDGSLRVIDGHRRALAAQLAGQDSIEAWLSRNVPVPDGRLDSNGKPIMTGLTYEIANQPKTSVDEILNSLPMDQPSRLARAREMQVSADHHNEALSYLLGPRSKVGVIGEEKGTVKPNGVSKLTVKNSRDGYEAHRLVYAKDGKIVGAMQITKTPSGKPQVANTFVDPEYRRQGIGTELNQAAEKAFGALDRSDGPSVAGQAFRDGLSKKNKGAYTLDQILDGIE
jgi:predicted GNAT family acetyltransferase